MGSQPVVSEQGESELYPGLGSWECGQENLACSDLESAFFPSFLLFFWFVFRCLGLDICYVNLLSQSCPGYTLASTMQVSDAQLPRAGAPFRFHPGPALPRCPVPWETDLHALPQWASRPAAGWCQTTRIPTGDGRESDASVLIPLSLWDGHKPLSFEQRSQLWAETLSMSPPHLWAP